MSTHTEWMHATNGTTVSVLPCTEEAPDGQFVECGNVGLLIEGDDAVVIEGTPAELHAFAERIIAVLHDGKLDELV
jgi:hypothetical protein